VNTRNALWLLGGWLLLMPPHRPDLPYPDSNAPVAQWIRLKAFDTARECEAERQRDLHDARKKHTKAQTDAALDVAEGEEICVPAEHIYPPAQPASTPASAD